MVAKTYQVLIIRVEITTGQGYFEADSPALALKIALKLGITRTSN